MGTNYYFTVKRDVCSCCGRFDKELDIHIGKSSAGWAFSLRVHPHLGINSLEDWKKLFCKHLDESYIHDEYGNECSLVEITNKIERKPQPWKRHELGGLCIAHGPEGLSYDLMKGEFC